MRRTSPFGQTALVALLAAVLGVMPATGVRAAAGSDRAYTIGNYPVEARASNAVAAKEQAIADGQKAAFRSLLKRIVPVTSYRSLQQLGPIDAASLIDGVSVRTERNSATAYIASLDFSFQANEVRNLLSARGIPYVDQQAPVTLVVPIIRDGKAAAGDTGEFRPASGTWSSVWPGLDLTNSVTPVRVETMKPDVQAGSLRQLYEGGGDPLTALAAPYGAERIVVAIAEVETEAGRVNVLLAGQDAVGPFSLKRSYKLSDGDLAYTLELAAVVSLGILEGRWKLINETGGASAAGTYGPSPYGDAGFAGLQDVAFEAEYASPSEWNEMRRVLLEAPGIDDIRIGSVSAGRASVSVKYAGGGPALAQALAPYGVSLQSTAMGWTMRSERR